MSVNTFLVFDDEGNYRFFLSCSDTIIDKIDYGSFKQQINGEEYEQYVNEINNGKFPKLNLETNEIIFIDYVKQ